MRTQNCRNSKYLPRGFNETRKLSCPSEEQYEVRVQCYLDDDPRCGCAVVGELKMTEFAGPANTSRHIPRAKSNHVRYVDRDTERVIEFVQGIFSDRRGRWLAGGGGSEHERYWRELVARDLFSIFRGGFFTDVDAVAFRLEDCAQQLFNALAEPNRPGETPVLMRILTEISRARGTVANR